MQDVGEILSHAIHQVDTIAISDSSLKDQYGTAAWVIEGCSYVGHLVGAAIVPGTNKDHSAYKSDLVGIYSILVAVKHICKYIHIKHGRIELGCDGKMALDKAFNYVSLVHIEDANYDLPHAIHTLTLVLEILSHIGPPRQPHPQGIEYHDGY